jgi:hypothetical protein
MSNIVSSYPNHYPLIRKLESIAALSDEQRQAVLSLPLTIRNVGADYDIVREGDRPSECCLIIEGFTCRNLQKKASGRYFRFTFPATFPTCRVSTSR